MLGCYIDHDVETKTARIHGRGGGFSGSGEGEEQC